MDKDYQLDPSLESYVQTLLGYGISVSGKLQPAIFQLRNGLKYPGLVAREAVEGPEELVRLPIDLLLTAHRALKDPALADLFSNGFYREGPLWQDRILVTYLLYLLSVDRDCIWTVMARRFSREIDIVSFWQEEEFGLFADRSVRKAATKERQHFEEEYERFEELREEYGELADEKWFNRENYRWIYIHTISRCFGSFLNSTYFVPYCELFNHNVVDVSYRCLDEQRPKREEKEGSSVSEDEVEEASVSSCYSEDYLSDDDFDYLSINSYSIKWLSKISYDLREKQVKAIDGQLAAVYEWLHGQMQWRGFTLIYLGQIIEKLKILQNEYKAGRRKFEATAEKIEDTRMHVHAYRKYLVEFYRVQGREYERVMRGERGVECSPAKNTSWSNYTKSQQERPEHYSHFVMEARELAVFPKGSQVFFCYGKLSNRTLLVRYGFCLEDNPYEHVWLKCSLRREIEPYPDLFEQVQEKGLPVNYKMKLKGHSFALDPVLLVRMKRWKLTHHRLDQLFCITDLDRELQTLETVKEIYTEHLQQYNGIEDDLTDPSLDYHQYFARVYNIEKRKIIRFQLGLIDSVEKLFLRIKAHKVDVKEFLKKQEWEKPLRHYLKGLRGLISV